MDVRRWRKLVGAEAPLAFVTGVVWFALGSVLLAVLPHHWLVAAGTVVVDVVVVLALARSWGIGFAVSAGMASVVAVDWYYIPPIHPADLPDAQNAVALLAYLVTGTLLGELAAVTRRRAQASERARGLLADEQAALRRVATLVAREASPDAVFAAVTEEVGRLLPVDVAALWRYESDGTVTIVGAWSRIGDHVRIGSRFPVAGDNMAAAVLATGGPVRIDSYADARGELAVRMRELGIRSSIGSPVLVDGRTWGVMTGASTSTQPIAPGTEIRLVEFTELAGTAVANAESRAELTASRARIVASGDQARRRIERDLHDGIQQRLVALALDARGAEGLAREARPDLADRLAQMRENLVGTVDELREVAHGIHPAILSEGGLRPAFAKLARRCAIPIELTVDGPTRLPEPIEVCLYYVVSEALTNVVKHAQATVAQVALTTDAGTVRLTVEDDGIGGVDVRHGSGMTGVRDRVDALGGSVEVTSLVGVGTTIRVRLPLSAD